MGGLVCCEARRRTRRALGDELLPLLLGVERAKKLTLQSLLRSHGREALRKVIRYLPSLKLYAPPIPVAVSVIALRRTAPVLFPFLALAPMCMNVGGLFSQVLLVIACVAMLG